MAETELEHIPFTRICIALTIATYLARRGLKKKSLSKSGAIAAFLVGLISFVTSYRMGITLILFYQSSSSLTKYKGDVKKTIEADFLEGGQRNYVQVLSCSIVGTLLATMYYVLEGEDTTIDWTSSPYGSFLLCAYLGHYACCNGDTWASELGVLNPSPPRLVTAPWRIVPAGTNGGMSLYGTLASLFGGLFIGIGFAALGLLYGPWQNGLVTIGCLGGVGGSLIDSILGATIQVTYYDEDKKMIVPPHNHIVDNNSKIRKVCGMDILNGEQVNFVSVVLTTLACGVWGKMFV